MEVLKRKEAGMEGRTAVAGTLGERELDWVGGPDPSRRREVKFAAKAEAAVRRR